MLTSLAFTLLSAFIPSSQATDTVEGQVVGNGGDVVTCIKSDENDFYGNYSLDYFLTHSREKAVYTLTWFREKENKSIVSFAYHCCHSYFDAAYLFQMDRYRSTGKQT